MPPGPPPPILHIQTGPPPPPSHPFHPPPPLQLLYQHCLAKHEGTSPSSCFSQLAGYVPEAEKSAEEVAASAAAAAAVAKAAPKPKPKTDLDALLEAGLNPKKK